MLYSNAATAKLSLYHEIGFKLLFQPKTNAPWNYHPDIAMVKNSSKNPPNFNSTEMEKEQQFSHLKCLFPAVLIRENHTTMG